MKFGSVDHPENIDYTLPEDHPDTLKVLNSSKNESFDAYVGCAKWNKQDLKGFYPRGVKEELEYYASQFNSIELNATHYRMYGPDQIAVWRDKTPGHFKFFPKVVNKISHIKRLKDAGTLTEDFCTAMQAFESKLGMIFLQMRDDFKPKDFDRVVQFLEIWPARMPLAVEFRHTDWYNERSVADQVYKLFEENRITNVITDTAGRRDLLHMRLTTPVAFIRYVGANHESDYSRLDDWIERLKEWKEQGLQKLYFFMHQNVEKESPKLSAYFINKLNNQLGTDLKVPELQD